MARILIITTAMFAFLATPHMAHAYSTGAPPGACDTMVPNHGGNAQSGTSTYNIMVPSEYSSNRPLTVALNGGSSFKGFFCQARTSANSNTRLGKFSIGQIQGIKLACNNQAVTHSNNVDKTSTQFIWTPAENYGDVYIVCSWVQTKPTYWVKETSTVIRNNNNNDSPADNGNGNSASHVTSRWYPYVIMAVLAVLVL